ncbi:MAG: alpha-galactosidase [Pirellulales bacterium]|nr:alpha-galactosidase [Pirellulales bacterium]
MKRKHATISRTMIAGLLTLTLSVGSVAGASTPADKSTSGWHIQSKAEVLGSFLKKGELPMAFTFGGRPSAELLSGWKFSVESKPQADQTIHTVKHVDPVLGLELVTELIEYKKFAALEWVHYFSNSGAEDSPIIDMVDTLRKVILIKPPQTEAVLHRSLGCTSTASDFAPVKDVVYPGYERIIAPLGGRSSNGAMPFFNLEIGGSRGVFVAVGWTGQWTSRFQREYGMNNGKITVTAGMERMRLRLRPGERIRTPRIALLFWEEKERIAAHNRFRKFIVEHHTPHINGKPAELIIAGSSFFAHSTGNTYSEANQLEFIDLYRKKGLDINCWWIDAGWFTGGWPDGVGNWFPRKNAFPNDFKKVSAEAHRQGMKFLLWFEPERVAEGSQLQREHPEWLLAAAEGAQKQGEVYCPSIGGPTNYLLNMGNPQARAWLTDHVSKMIADNKIDIYRHDANIDPMNFWQHADEPDRLGMAEIRYVEGLYEYWEELKRRHPGLLVENCCSGNRRFDLETVGRTVNLWRTDYCFRPTADQCQTYGLSYYLPVHANVAVKSDKYTFRSILGTSFVTGDDPRRPDYPLEEMRENIKLFYRVRPLLYGDYYPLTPYSTREDVWLAYQFHNDELKTGVVFAFRRPRATDVEQTLKLGGLTAGAEYVVENIDTGKKEMLRGSQLLEGLNVRIESFPGSAVFLYKRKG